MILMKIVAVILFRMSTINMINTEDFWKIMFDELNKTSQKDWEKFVKKFDKNFDKKQKFKRRKLK